MTRYQEILPRTKDERPKGFTTYTPQSGSKMARYMDAGEELILGTTARRSTRFWAYRIVSVTGGTHDDVDYAEDAILMLRRTKRIPLNAVIDSRTEWSVPWTVTATEAAQSIHDELDDLYAERQGGQSAYVVLMMEATGSVVVAQEVATEYGVPILSGSGSVPITATSRLAVEAIGRYIHTRVPTVVLCWTDLDLKGITGIYVPFALDVEKFALDHVMAKREAWGITVFEAEVMAQSAIRVERLGPTPAQVLANVKRPLLNGVPHISVAVLDAAGNPVRLDNGRIKKQSVEVPWWRGLIGDFSLPTAEALEDALPGILRAGFDQYLPDADKRANVTATEAALREDAAAKLVRLLSEGGED